MRLVDLSLVAVKALKYELSGYKAKAYISFTGDESDCNAAVLQYEQVLKVCPMQCLSMHLSMSLSALCVNLLQALVVTKLTLTVCHGAMLSK